MKKYNNRPSMPEWFTTEYAKFFRTSFTKEEFDQFMEAKSGMVTTALKEGIDPKTVTTYWYKGKNYSIKANPKKLDFLALTEQLVDHIKDYAPTFDDIKRKEYDDPLLYCISPTDSHFGKLARSYETGSEYNLALTKNKFKDGVNGLVEYIDNYPIDQIIMVGGNDVLHTDMFNKTTRGTPQDTSGMFYDMFNTAFTAYIDAIDLLLQKADVYYVHCMSNHDYHAGWYFSKALEAYYFGHPNIAFNTSPSHRKYVQYGLNLLGFSHGDGAKDNVLVDLMKRECKGAWSKSKFGYWFLGHLHHHIRKQDNKVIGKDQADIMMIRGSEKDLEDKVQVQYLRSISGTDSYHHKYGYDSPKAMEAFLHHPTEGQIARFTKFV